MTAPALRVLHIVAGNLFGGVETMLIALARQNRDNATLESAFAVCFPGRLTEALQQASVPLTLLGAMRTSRPWQVWRARRALRRLLTGERFGAVICHMPWSLAVFGPAIRRAGLPLVFWMHDAANGVHWVERWARRSLPDLAIVNSRFTAGTLPKLFSHPPAHVVILEPANLLADAAPNAAERARARAEFDTPEDHALIVQVSRMEPYKGHLAHLQALARLRDLPGWTAWIVGGAQRPQENEYLTQLKNFALQNGIDARVRFLGERRDVPRLLAAADLFCQPNVRGEPFGIVFIEALNAGLPVVTSAIGGALEIVDETCGRLTPPDSPEALADSLRELIVSPALRAELGRNGPARAAALSHPAVIVGKLDVALRELLDGRFGHGGGK